MLPDSEVVPNRWRLAPVASLTMSNNEAAVLVGHDVITPRSISKTGSVDVRGILTMLASDDGLTRDDLESGRLGDPEACMKLLAGLDQRGIVDEPYVSVEDPLDRQMPYYGLFGQGATVGNLRVRASSVAVVGLGALGGPVAWDLAVAGVSELHLIDFDNVELSNLNRQHTYRRTDVGRAKTAALADALAELRPEVALRVHDRKVETIADLPHADDLDVVVCAADWPPSVFEACAHWAVRHGALCAFAGVGLGRGFVGPFLRSGATFAPDREGGVVPFSFGPANQVIASILSAELIRYLATGGSDLIDHMLVVDTARWTFARVPSGRWVDSK